MRPFQILREIKSVSFATVSGGMPQVRIFEANPMMNDLYPGDKRDILDAFCIYRAVGEIFDLGTHPPHRRRFAFGGAAVRPPGYRITGSCRDVCPAEAIEPGIGL